MNSNDPEGPGFGSVLLSVCPFADREAMAAMLRAAFEAPDGVVRIFIICRGCLQDLMVRHELPRKWVSEVHGAGTECEFCQAEIHAGAQSD